MSEKTITLISIDNESFEVSLKVAQQSELIKGMTVDGGIEDEIPLPNLKGSILSKVLQFCKHVVAYPLPEIEKPLKSAIMSEIVPEWFATYTDCDLDTIFELLLAANYLDIPPLIELVSARVASLMKNKTPDQIRKQFNISNDLTPDEERKIMEDNKWMES